MQFDKKAIRRTRHGPTSGITARKPGLQDRAHCVVCEEAATDTPPRAGLIQRGSTIYEV
jgi:hypothetical protein